MLFFSTRYGLCIDDVTATLATGKRRNGSLSVGKHAGVKLSKGVVTNGTVQDPDTLVEALAKLKREFRKRGAMHVTLCLPPQHVYLTHTVIDDAIGRAGSIQQALPEYVEALSVHEDRLRSKEKKQERVALRAVVKEQAELLVAICQKAGFVVDGLCTASLASTVLHAVQSPSLFVWRDGLGSTSVSICEQGRIVDEDVLEPKADAEHIVESIEHILLDEAGMGITQVFGVADSKTMQELSELLKNSKREAKLLLQGVALTKANQAYARAATASLLSKVHLLKI